MNFKSGRVIAIADSYTIPKEQKVKILDLFKQIYGFACIFVETFYTKYSDRLLGEFRRLAQICLYQTRTRMYEPKLDCTVQ